MNANVDLHGVFDDDDSSQSSNSSSPTVSSSSTSVSTSSDDDDSLSAPSLALSISSTVRSTSKQNSSALEKNTLPGSPSVEYKTSKVKLTAMKKNDMFMPPEEIPSKSKIKDNVPEVEVVAQILSNEPGPSDDEEQFDKSIHKSNDKKTTRIKLFLSKKSDKSSNDEGAPISKKRGAEDSPTVEATIISSSLSLMENKKPKTLLTKNNLRSACHEASISHSYKLRPIKMPPIVSPGLLITNNNSGGNKGSNTQSNGNSVNTSAADSISNKAGNKRSTSNNSNLSSNKLTNNNNRNSMTTPSTIFNKVMEAAGYTMEQRSSNPHRGSSVTREVDDMFDRDIMVTLNFKPLVPEWILESPTSTKQETKDSNKASMNHQLPCIFMETMQDVLQLDHEHKQMPTQENNHSYQFEDMLPTSLTADFPESYIKKRIQFELAAAEREHAIAKSQEASAKAENDMILYEEAKEKWESRDSQMVKKSSSESSKHFEVKQEVPLSKPIAPPTFIPHKIPPIPSPLIPPTFIKCPSSPTTLESTEMMPRARNSKEDLTNKHYQISQEKRYLVSHLDPSFFSLSRRYYGLLSNKIADPQFVGPNAPGLTGGGSGGNSSNAVSGSTSLATAQSSSSTGVVEGSGGVVFGRHLGSDITGGISYQGKVGNSVDSGKFTMGASSLSAAKSVKKSSSIGGLGPPDKKKTALGNKGKNNTTSNSNVEATRTNTDLKKAFEVGGEFAENMRISLIKAAIHACESSSEGPWLAYNGETYPDVS